MRNQKMKIICEFFLGLVILVHIIVLFVPGLKPTVLGQVSGWSAAFFFFLYNIYLNRLIHKKYVQSLTKTWPKNQDNNT